MEPATHTIEALFEEGRTFKPPAEFKEAAIVSSDTIYAEAAADPSRYWEDHAKSLVWHRLWEAVLDWSDAPFARWFVGGRLNVTESCLDRHLDERGDRIAYHWEGEPGDRRTLTYSDLHAEVCQCANALAELGVEKGDRVAIYMGMVPELPIAILACARLGAVHSVVFGGFSSEALSDRINDAQAKVLVTCDGAWRGGQVVPLKEMADEALLSTPSITAVLVVQRVGSAVAMDPRRDVWYHDIVPQQEKIRAATECDSEDLLFLLYTSGTTAKPKGIVHTCAGYLVGAMATHKMVFDIHPESDVYWCTADIGWVTGHSYVVYGPLANGSTSVIFEGAPHFPDKDRFWDVVERYKVSILYTAPTSIRTFMKWGNEYPEQHDLSSLRLLGTVGEPINPEAWIWYRDVIGSGRCPVVDTWWQTETGSIMISPLPGLTTTKPGSATFPLPGTAIEIVNDVGEALPLGDGGYLVITQPWPSMLRGIYGDNERYIDTYWRRFSKPNEDKWVYFAGDGAKRDGAGNFWLLGRVDDVMNISGHRISTLEVESALVDHQTVAEAAVVGRADSQTGQAIAAFVTLKGVRVGDEQLIRELRDHVATKIGKIARPASIVFTDELPKTRSGKIMRRLLQDISERRMLGDVTTLANADVVKEIAQRAKEAQPSAD